MCRNTTGIGIRPAPKAVQEPALPLQTCHNVTSSFSCLSSPLGPQLRSTPGLSLKSHEGRLLVSEVPKVGTSPRNPSTAEIRARYTDVLVPRPEPGVAWAWTGLEEDVPLQSVMGFHVDPPGRSWFSLNLLL